MLPRLATQTWTVPSRESADPVVSVPGMVACWSIFRRHLIQREAAVACSPAPYWSPGGAGRRFTGRHGGLSSAGSSHRQPSVESWSDVLLGGQGDPGPDTAPRFPAVGRRNAVRPEDRPRHHREQSSLVFRPLL